MAVREWSRWLDDLRREEVALHETFGRVVKARRGALERLETRLRPPSARLDRLRIAVDRRVEALAARVRRELGLARARLGRQEERLFHLAPAERLGRVRERLGRLDERLAAAAANSVGRRRASVAALAGTLEALGPRSVLSRGYAIVRTPQGRVLRDAARCAPGDPLEILLARGSLASRVTSVQPGPTDQETQWTS
jgi:exodeoxyribonuclease VII large subunit